MKEKLNIYSKNLTSQHGEDGILEYIVKSLGGKIHKTCCEFGAWDGVFASNCYDLWRNHGWSAILIEGDKEKYQDLVVNTKGEGRVDSLCCLLKLRGRDSLDSIFKQRNFPKKIGILSIDIDSYDYHIWKNIEYVDPQIVIIEHNQFIPAYIDSHDPEDESYLRCSAKALESLGTQKGYKLICCTLSNSIFIKNDLFDNEKFPDYPVEHLFDYSAISSQILMTGVNDNRYPIFSKKMSSARKFLCRFYFKLISLIKSDVKYAAPSKKMKKHLKVSSLDA